MTMHSNTVDSKAVDYDQLQDHLEGVDYPAGKEEILQFLMEDAVPSQVAAPLQALPERLYHNVTEVMNALHNVN